ncbi:hypothetical protein KI387_001055, partial [Taxus chinensis]
MVKRSNPMVDIHLVSLTLPPLEGLPTGIESCENILLHMNDILFKSSHKLAPELEQWLELSMKNAENPNENEFSSSPSMCL